MISKLLVQFQQELTDQNTSFIFIHSDQLTRYNNIFQKYFAKNGK